tara:strand:+ start:335 stop:619 length:285 start_codon:yes stop_codon:yes gene_type:complete
MNVKVFRMISGEEVICTLLEENAAYIEVENPLIALPAANGQVGFGPWSVLQKEKTTLKVDKKHMVYMCEAREEIVDNYQKIFSPIETPSKKLIL